MNKASYDGKATFQMYLNILSFKFFKRSLNSLTVSISNNTVFFNLYLSVIIIVFIAGTPEDTQLKSPVLDVL